MTALEINLFMQGFDELLGGQIDLVICDVVPGSMRTHCQYNSNVTFIFLSNRLLGSSVPA